MKNIYEKTRGTIDQLNAAQATAKTTLDELTARAARLPAAAQEVRELVRKLKATRKPLGQAGLDRLRLLLDRLEQRQTATAVASSVATDHEVTVTSETPDTEAAISSFITAFMADNQLS